MSTSAALRQIFAAGRPLIEQWLDVAEQISALRDTATANGLDWSQVKALLKAQIQDERDEPGDGKRVRRIVEKAEFASAYADMLGLAKMNEKNSFAGSVTATAVPRSRSDERLADESSSSNFREESRERQMLNPAPSMGTEGSKPEASPSESNASSGVPAGTAAIISEPAPSAAPVLPGRAPDGEAGEAQAAATASPTPFDEEPELPSFCDRRNWVDGHPPKALIARGIKLLLP